MDCAALQVKPGDVVDGAGTVPEPHLLTCPFHVGALLELGEFIDLTQRHQRWIGVRCPGEIVRPVDLRVLPHALTQGLDRTLCGVGRGLEPIGAQPGHKPGKVRGVVSPSHRTSICAPAVLCTTPSSPLKSPSA